MADSVTGPGGIPHISPSATSPAITDADDDGYLFRTTGSDAVQGVVLAQLVESEGHTNVGVIFRDDAWGQGLSEVFNANYSGTATLVSYAAVRRGTARRGAGRGRAASGRPLTRAWRVRPRP